jgi:hypothetical protein
MGIPWIDARRAEIGVCAGTLKDRATAMNFVNGLSQKIDEFWPDNTKGVENDFKVGDAVYFAGSSCITFTIESITRDGRWCLILCNGLARPRLVSLSEVRPVSEKL